MIMRFSKRRDCQGDAPSWVLQSYYPAL